MRNLIISIITATLLLACQAEQQAEPPAVAARPPAPGAPYMATGIKIGEVTATEAIVWVRLTANEQRVPDGAPMPVVTYTHAETGEPFEVSGSRRPSQAVPAVSFPDGSSIGTIEGAAPGARGVARIHYKPETAAEFKETEWQKVQSDADYTTQFRLSGLLPGTRYAIRIETGVSIRGVHRFLDGSFRTAPAPDTVEPVTFTVVTGQRYPNRDSETGWKIYDSMLNIQPNFFVHTGDILYYDRLGKSKALADWHWQRTYSLGKLKNFHKQVPSYFIKDDHDTFMNDAWPTMETHFMGDFTFEQGLEVFRYQVPMGEKTYRTIRWGKDLQVWLVEGRDFRSANPDPDGPGKTIWGEEQMEWFKSTVEASDATFKVLISPTPVVGPDRPNKNDNHANEGFAHEGNMLREFIASQDNMVVACGDRHWQYVSVDATHGVREYSSGPASDKHAGGWSNDMILPEHRYLNVIGGFLAITVDREDGIPVLIGRHYGVDGGVLNEDRVAADQDLQ